MVAFRTSVCAVSFVVVACVMQGRFDCTASNDAVAAPSAVPHWAAASAEPANVRDLHREYRNIFKHGNRNAASHRWAAFLLQRAHQMTEQRLDLFFSGFCAVSGSPVRPSDYNRYRLTLPQVGGAGSNAFATGYMHYCCWPCVCDTQDWIRVDTRSVATLDGNKSYHFAVIGNPCKYESQLHEPFVQPFGRGETTLARTAVSSVCRPIHVANRVSGGCVGDGCLLLAG